jgi:hypothetical protein
MSATAATASKRTRRVTCETCRHRDPRHFHRSGGLGSLITTGIRLLRYPVLISGALLVGSLALLMDWAGRLLEEIAPKEGFVSRA